MGLSFEVRTKETDESFPQHLQNEQVVMHLALKKAQAFEDELTANEIIITADTIVVFENKILNKPVDRQDAVRMLSMLASKKHDVFTGVCMADNNKKELFFDKSEVYFRNYSAEDIQYYIDHYKPFDKAGAYGIQDWFGLTCVEKINGCFYNVMGLPARLVYNYLKQF
jgi:septum formation protein